MKITNENTIGGKEKANKMTYINDESTQHMRLKQKRRVGEASGREFDLICRKCARYVGVS